MRVCPKCGENYADQVAFCPTDGAATQVLGAARPQDSFLGMIVDGRYRIEQRIGDGGMGVVYRATHVVLKKAFAIKVVRGDQAHDPEIVQRFVQEARSASAIGHPNIVDISDFGTMSDGEVYLVMEFLVGQTLAKAMEAGALAYPRALDIFVQITAALEAAHERGIVHRDLKPENVFLKREPDNPDFVKVLDFGIAKVRNAAAKITRTGMVFGTPHYMSPEQAAGQPVDHRSDIYSLGVMMYQVLAGQLPFDAESIMQIMTKHMYEPPPSPRELGIALPSGLESIVLHTLQKKPEDRPQSMRELREALQRVQLDPGSEPAPAPALPRDSEPAARERESTSETSETLAAAARHDIVSDDELVAVPKLRGRAWLWGLAVCLALGVAALTFAGSGRSASAPAPGLQPTAADSSAPDAAADERATPAHEQASGTPEQPEHSAPEHRAREQHPSQHSAAPRPAAPKPAEHAQPPTRKPPSHAEPQDPWR